MLAKDHTELVRQLHLVKEICVEICRKKGHKCSAEVLALRESVPTFVEDMEAHLQEEEENIPALLRAHFTEKENQAVVQKIIAKAGLSGCRFEVPAILYAMEDWATPAFRQGFIESIPAPIRHLVFKYYIPDYQNSVVPMRDAPLLKGGKPPLKKVGCFGLPFCFACVV